jgi:hypothetical protein
MRFTIIIASVILFGLAAYAKLLAMAQPPTEPCYSPIPISSPIHLAHLSSSDQFPN